MREAGLRVETCPLDNPKPTDLNQIVFGIEDIIRRTLGQGCQLEIVSSAAVWPTLVDTSQTALTRFRTQRESVTNINRSIACFAAYSSATICK